jgi:hypothetical protein
MGAEKRLVSRGFVDRLTYQEDLKTGTTSRLLSLRTFAAFAIVANSHHPGQFEKHWQILAGIGL